MISWLKGKVISSDEQSLVLDVAGVGYELLVSLAVFSGNISKGTELELVVFTDVKETSISLFGFADKQEKQVFLLLRKVKGVGSKLAMTIISSIGASNVLQAIGLEDVASLTKVPGVGKKSAERIIVELREKVTELVGIIKSSGSPRIQRTSKATANLNSLGDAGSDAVLALEKLGFGGSKAADVVSQVLAENAQLGAGEILRKALASL